MLGGLFFGGTTMTEALLGYIVKFKDGVKEPPAAQLYYPLTQDGFARAQAFAQQQDEKGFSVYSCIGRLRNTPRNKQNVAELSNLVLDLDLRNIAETREQVLKTLRDLPLPPEIRDSGRGIHAVWHLKEPLVDDAGMAQAETTMRRLVTLLAGDPKPTHRAALLRHLGTHNSRDNEWRECRVLEDGKPCDINQAQAAQRLNLSVSKFRAEQNAGRINGKRHGRIWTFTDDDLDAYLDG